MNRFITLLVTTFIAGQAQLLALSGGPFDNGYSSSRLEDGAVYQAVLSYRNGSGFCYFHPEQNLVSENLVQSALSINARGSLQNRSVLYYKGMSYIGSAMGMTDPDSRFLMCVLNASSDVTNSQQNNQVGAGAATTSISTSTVSVANGVMSNNRGFIANGNWEARMNKMAPTRRFFGRGEIVFVSPTGADAVAGLAFQGYSGLINAIVQSVGGVTDFDDTIVDIYGTAQTAINNALASLPGFLAGGGLDALQSSGDTVKVGVRGTLRYL